MSDFFLLRLFFFIIIIPSAIFHEYMHGWVAERLGDPTARYAGRLTLNPLAHIDLWGTILLPLMLFAVSGGQFLFAYAKPVPYNPYNLRDQRYGPMWVAVAGPLSNFFLAAVFGVMVQIISHTGAGGLLPVLLSVIVYANVLLGVFNLVPIPPLDGSKVLFAVLPDSLSHFKAMLERFGFILLLVFMVFFFDIIRPVIEYLFGFFTGGGGIF